MMPAGFEAATHGEIMLNGRPINDTPPHKRGIGMVFQNYALFPHMTVAENLAFPLEVRSMPSISPAPVARFKRRALRLDSTPSEDRPGRASPARAARG